MKTRFIWLGIVAACILAISTAFVSCENDVSAVVKYVGKVVYAGSTKPFANLEVKVTNGEKIHDLSHTDDYGAFSLTVKVGDIDGSYYVLIGDSSCATKKIELSGYGQEQVDLGTIEIEGPGLPTVTTKPITDISDNKATSGGNVTADGRASVTARGVCWSKSEYPTIEDEHTQNGSGLGEFKSQLTNLEAGATYYVRAYATNRLGTAYGEQLTLSSKTGLPQVTTDEVSHISATTATCGGEVAANSGYAITARGICWSDKTATPTINNDHTEEVATTGHFTSMMIGLERSTTYYVRAYAVNEKGTNYGETKTFTTLSGLPTVTTAQVTDIKATTAICGGNVTSNGGYTITARGICWSSISSTPTIDDSHTNEVADNGAFSSLMTGLEPNITYYVRAYAINEVGICYGNKELFLTENGLPKVSTISPRLVDDYVSTGCNVTDAGGASIITCGICYGESPTPDLSSNFNHTNDGNGVGIYSSSFLLPIGSGLRYIRAYATNDYGTSYGQQVTIIQPYDELPTFRYEGHLYKVAPTSCSPCTWSYANQYCANLTIGGFTDWRLPSGDELDYMYEARQIIGGFYNCSIPQNQDYFFWSSSTWKNGQGLTYVHAVDFNENGFSWGAHINSEYFVRPVRVEE